MAQAMRAAAGDADAARRKGEAGRRLVAPLSWDALAETTAGLLNEALGTAPAGATAVPVQEPA
jgi:hypothetical protein